MSPSSSIFTLHSGPPHFSSLAGLQVPGWLLPASWWSWQGRKKQGEGCEGPPNTECVSAVPILSSKPSTWQLNGRLSKIYRRLGRNPASQGVSWQKQNWQISICAPYPFLSQPEALFSQQTPYPFGKEQLLPVSVDMSIAAQPERA